MKRVQNLRQRVAFLFRSLPFVACLVALIQCAPTYAQTAPTITVASNQLRLGSDLCATAIVHGEDFTPSGFPVTSTIFKAIESGRTLSIRPSKTTIGINGNIDLSVKICGLTTDPFQAIAFTATNSATHVDSNTITLSISLPNPVLQSPQTDSQLLAGCATVKLFGDNFIPSGTKINHATITGSSLGIALKVKPAKVNTLVDGNIATSAQFCGLTTGQTFDITAHDALTGLSSNTISVLTY
jgi:hypothetical protein